MSTDFLDERLPLAEQLRRILFPKESAETFMDEQAACSVDGGLAFLLGKGYEDKLKSLIASVADLEQGKVEAIEQLHEAVERHKEEVDASVAGGPARDRNDIDQDLYASAEEVRRAHPPRQPRLPGA